MTLKRSHWHGSLVLLVCAWLAGCRPSGPAEQLMALAEQARRDGQLQMAAALYHRAAELHPQPFHIHYRTALLYVQVENMPRAEEHLRKTLALKPDFGPAHVSLGVVLLRQGSREDSRRAFLEALRWDPRLPKAYYHLGVMTAQDGHLDAAEALFRKALALNRYHQASYVRLGNLYVKQHRFAAALDVLQRAMRLNPRDSTTFFHSGPGP
jgi:tetratricopeptide (TPR) repeat protein